MAASILFVIHVFPLRGLRWIDSVDSESTLALAARAPLCLVLRLDWLGEVPARAEDVRPTNLTRSLLQLASS